MEIRTVLNAFDSDFKLKSENVIDFLNSVVKIKSNI